jgi:DNA mismatch repair protein MutL
MSKITILSQELVNQIAAGEVVERPVSVIKELVENSLDAGATSIQVDIEQWWLQSITVVDNGGWIESEDMTRIWIWHSTSKIHTLEDIYKIMTFGFRWEALASISSVSDFEIHSAVQDSYGKRLFFKNGERKIEDSPMNVGTKIVVKNLFARTPARLNYLKSEKTEQSHIVEYLQNLALFYPNVTFELTNSGKKVFLYPAVSSSKERIFALYGEWFLNQLLLLEFELFGMKIEGYISDPKFHFQNKNKQIIAVNGRLIKSPIIYRALSEAYNRYIPHGTFPAYILNLRVNPTEIDINVHPRKLEIRFAHEQEVYRSFYNGISSRLESVSLLSANSYSEPFSLEITNISPPLSQQYYTGSGTKFKSYSPYKDTNPHPHQWQVWQALEFSEALLSHTAQNLQNVPSESNSTRVIWQLWNSYILVEKEKKFLILDQHALAERVLYEKLASKRSQFQTQKLLLPLAVHLNPKEQAILWEYKDTVLSLWFEWEELPSGIHVHSIPDFTKKEDISVLLPWILADIDQFNAGKSRTLEEVQNKMYAYASCRAAIKFWHILSQMEMEQLVHDAEITYSSTCPHGRPVIFEVSLEELKGKFDR